MNKIINWLNKKYLQFEDYVKGYLHLKQEAKDAQEKAEHNFLERINNVNK